MELNHGKFFLQGIRSSSAEKSFLSQAAITSMDILLGTRFGLLPPIHTAECVRDQIEKKKDSEVSADKMGDPGGI